MRMLKEKYADQVKKLVKFNVDTLPETGTIDTKDQAILGSDDKEEARKAREKADKKMQKDGDKNIEETADEQKKVEIAKKELPKEKGITEAYNGSQDKGWRTGWYPIDATEDTPWDAWKQMADDYGKSLKVEEPAILEIIVAEVEDRSRRDEQPRAHYMVKFDKSLEQEAIRSLKARDMLFINPQGPEDGVKEKVIKGMQMDENKNGKRYTGVIGFDISKKTIQAIADKEIVTVGQKYKDITNIVRKEIDYSEDGNWSVKVSFTIADGEEEKVLTRLEKTGDIYVN